MFSSLYSFVRTATTVHQRPQSGGWCVVLAVVKPVAHASGARRVAGEEGAEEEDTKECDRVDVVRGRDLAHPNVRAPSGGYLSEYLHPRRSAVDELTLGGSQRVCSAAPPSSTQAGSLLHLYTHMQIQPSSRGSLATLLASCLSCLLFSHNTGRSHCTAAHFFSPQLLCSIRCHVLPSDG